MLYELLFLKNFIQVKPNYNVVLLRVCFIDKSYVGKKKKKNHNIPTLWRVTWNLSHRGNKKVIKW